MCFSFLWELFVVDVVLLRRLVPVCLWFVVCECGVQ